MVSFVRTLSRFSKSEIESLKAHAKLAVRTSAFTILTSDGSPDNGRILLIIPKKVGSAPRRNKLRRQIKTIYREEHLYTRGHDWVVIVKIPATNLSFTEIKELMLTVHARL